MARRWVPPARAFGNSCALYTRLPRWRASCVRPLSRTTPTRQGRSPYLQTDRLHVWSLTPRIISRHADGPTDVCLRPPSEAAAPYTSLAPGLSIASPRLGHALWEVYLSPSSPAPEARKAWLAAVRSLGSEQ